MFTQLVESGKSLRLPLLTGYSLMFVGWLIWYDDLPSEKEASDFANALGDLAEELGSAALVALVTFAALTLGTLVCNTILSRFLDLVARQPWMPDWDLFIDEAYSDAVSYEEYDVRASLGVHGTTVPSGTKARKLDEEYEDRRKARADAEFRLGAAVVLAPMCIGLGIRGGGGWWLALIAIAIFLAHVFVAHRRTLAYMYERHRCLLQEKIARREELVARRAETPPDPNTPPIPTEADLAARDEHRRSIEDQELIDLRAELEKLNKRSFRLDAQRHAGSSAPW